MPDAADITFADPATGIVFDPSTSGVSLGPSLQSQGIPTTGTYLGQAIHTLGSGDIVGGLAEGWYAFDHATGGNVIPATDTALAAADKATKPLQLLGSGLLSHPYLVIGGIAAAVFLGPMLLRKVLA